MRYMQHSVPLQRNELQPALLTGPCTITELIRRRTPRSFLIKGGGGQTFFRAFINSELGLPEVAPCMARTFGGVYGHRRRTGSEIAISPRWS